MSMTISAANYLGNSYQDTRTAGEERQEQTGPTADVGKTRRSTVSASLDQANMGRDGIAVTEVSRRQEAERSAPREQSTAPYVDTVEISEEGRAAGARLQERQAEPAGAEAERYEVEDLSEYTDTELRQMYYKGEITRQEYEDETGETLE